MKKELPYSIGNLLTPQTSVNAASKDLFCCFLCLKLLIFSQMGILGSAWGLRKASSHGGFRLREMVGLSVPCCVLQ